MVSQTLPETLYVWRNGSVVYQTPANTGVDHVTPDGTWPVFLRFLVTTMSGTNPNGTQYVDPGIPWVSYFHDSDAVHGFPRATYGWPQSAGCVEIPIANAAIVFPMDPIGTLVTVTTGNLSPELHAAPAYSTPAGAAIDLDDLDHLNDNDDNDDHSSEAPPPPSTTTTTVPATTTTVAPSTTTSTVPARRPRPSRLRRRPPPCRPRPQRRRRSNRLPRHPSAVIARLRGSAGEPRRDRKAGVEGHFVTERGHAGARRRRVRRTAHRLDGYGAPAILRCERVPRETHHVFELLLESEDDLGDGATAGEEPKRRYAVVVTLEARKAVVERELAEFDPLAARKPSQTGVERQVRYGKSAASRLS